MAITDFFSNEFPNIGDDGAIQLSKNTGIAPGETRTVVTTATIGDGTQTATGDFDYYSVFLVAGTWLTAASYARAWGSGLDSVLTIFDGAGTQLAQNDDYYSGYRDSLVKFQVATSGFYTIRVSSFDDSQANPFNSASGDGTINTTGSYTLFINTGTADFNSDPQLGNNVIGDANDNVIDTGMGHDTIDGGLGDDVLNGGLGDDDVSGGGGNNRFIWNIDNFGAQADTYRLGSGPTQSAIVLVHAAAASNTIVYSNGTTVTSDDDTLTMADNPFFKSIFIYGGSGADQLTVQGTESLAEGTSSYFNLHGGGDSDILTGGGNLRGNLNGEDGDDTLIADAVGGADQFFYGGNGNDTYIVNRTANVSIHEATFATVSTADKVRAAVNFTLTANAAVEFIETALDTSTTSINLTGNNLAQTIKGNNGINVLDGGADALTDTLIGLDGNDIYVIRSATDNITEIAGGGTADRARAAVSFTLAAGDNIEILESTLATGTGALNLTGNEIAQSITGNDGINTLSGAAGIDAINGRAGNDFINGGLGNDTLTGGLGSDNFVFNTALNALTNKDNIIDFNVAQDTIRLENTGIFTALGATLGTLSAAKFFTGAAAHDADDRIIYNKATGDIFYDSNGIGAGGMIKFAHVTPNLALTNADFFVI